MFVIENVLLALLTVATNQIPYVASPEEHYAQYMRQFAFLASSVGREALVGVLDAFAKRMPELEVVVCASLFKFILILCLLKSNKKESNSCFPGKLGEELAFCCFRWQTRCPDSP